MPDPGLARLRELFEAIVDLPDAERLAHLATLTPDPALQQHALRLARANDLSTSRATGVQRRLRDLAGTLAVPEVGVGEVLGVWRLTSSLGQGGMGAVFLAERCDGHFEQQAALKVLQGAPSTTALAMLAAERQILARLTHPNIARLLDGGATPKGRPYLVMDYVQGQTLDPYLAQHQPGLRARLCLFLAVCHTVAFAHARLVVHCDLKPSNIVVDADGRPVLLDFGIARLLDATLHDEGDAQVHAYTPGYASPELRRGDAVGIATDIYSLGVVLQRMVEADAPADLRSIVARATATEAGGRYDSATLLAQDVEAFLEGYPVRAHPRSWRYATGKLLRRRWPAFAVGVAFLALVFAFTWRLARERNEAIEARAQAVREADTATASNEFLQSLFDGADVDKGGARELSALSLVERGRERLDTDLAGQPATRATMYGAIAQVYANLGEPQKAAAAFERAIALERALVPQRPLRLSQLLRDASVLASSTDKATEAEALAREALALAERHAPPISGDVGHSATALALAYTRNGRTDEADTLLLRHLEIRQALGEPDVDLASTWHNLGLNAARRGDLERAADYYRRAWQAKVRALGAEHTRTLNSAETLAGVLRRARRFAEAIPLMEQVLAGRRKALGERSARTIFSAGELANAHADLGQYQRCVGEFRQVLADSAVTDGAQSPTYARYLNNLAYCHDRAGEPEAAIEATRQSLAIRRATLPEGDLAIARVAANLGRLLTAAGRLDEAGSLLEEADGIRRARLDAGQEETIIGTLLLADWARRRGELDQAQSRLDGLPAVIKDASPGTQLMLQRMRAWLLADRRDADAARRTMAAYVAGARARYGDGHVDALGAELDQLELWLALDDRAAVARDLPALATRLRAAHEAFAAASTVIQRAGRLEQAIAAGP